MCTQAFDARLQHFLKREIKKLPLEQRLQLKSIYHCCEKVIPANGAKDGVFLLRNDKNDVKFFGQMTCKNPWACPHCTAMMMAKYSKKISAAIDAMREKGYAAFMLTLSVPHIKKQSCREVTDILYKTWSDWAANVWKKSKNFTVLGKMFNELGIEHYVRVAEYTYGKNGWHPHFHCLFWLPKKNLQAVAAFEEQIRERWSVCWKRQYDLFATVDKSIFEFTDSKQSLNISKDESGSVRECLTSDYICGWGADKELTGNVQKHASHSSHFTPYQMLEFAADGNKNMLNLYIEFMLQVTKKPVHWRVTFDKRGLNAIIKTYINTEGYKSLIAKKNDSSWKVVAWFTSEEWQSLCDENKNSPVISNIIYLTHIKKEDLLEKYLEVFGVKLVKSAHLHTKVVEDIYNKAA